MGDPPRHLLLLVHGPSRARVRDAISCAAAAGVSGWRVDLVFFGEALQRWVQGDLDDEEGGDSASADPADTPPVVPTAQLLETANRAGRVRVMACSASCAEGGIDPPRVLEHVDEIVGWPTILRLVERVTQTLTF